MTQPIPTTDVTEPGSRGVLPRDASLMGRTDELTVAAIKALANGDDPFEHPFLAEHNVSLDEAYDLADQMALGLALLRHCKKEMGRPVSNVGALLLEAAGDLMKLTGQ